jgi:hypothetical protein
VSNILWWALCIAIVLCLLLKLIWNVETQRDGMGENDE